MLKSNMKGAIENYRTMYEIIEYWDAPERYSNYLNEIAYILNDMAYFSHTKESIINEYNCHTRVRDAYWELMNALEEVLGIEGRTKYELNPNK